MKFTKNNENFDLLDEIQSILEQKDFELLNDYSLLISLDRDYPYKAFNILGLYALDKDNWKTNYLNSQVMIKHWRIDDDMNIKKGAIVSISQDLYDIRKEMIKRGITILQEKSIFAEYMNIDWLIFDINNIHEKILKLPSHNQISVSFDRFSARHYFENFGGKPLLQQFIDAVNDYSSLRVINSHPMCVTLVGENANDAGGPGREIFTNICMEINNPEMNVFVYPPFLDYQDNSYLIPNLNAPEEMLKASGAFIAACITSSMPYQFNFAKFFWESISGSDPTIEDVYEVHPYFKQMISNIKNSQSNETLNGMYFIIDDIYNNQVELIKGGSKIKLTVDNFQTFISLANKLLIDELKDSMKFIKQGFYSVIPKKIITALSSEEVMYLCCKTSLSIQDFKNSTIYRSSDTEIFWKAVEKLSTSERRKLVRFICGRSSLYNQRKINIIVDRSLTFPRSYTCFNYLYIPLYDNVAQAEGDLKLCIESTLITDSIEDLAKYQ